MEKQTKKEMLQPLSTSEIAQLYGISNKTLNRWLIPHHEHIGKRIGRYYTIKQVITIFRQLGIPGHYELADIDEIQ